MKKLSLLFALLLLFSVFASCTPRDDDNISSTLKIGVLSGPTGMGLAELSVKAANDESLPYEFTLYASPDIAVTDFLTGALDAVCLPSNTAAMLYNKQDSDVRVLAVNCLSSLFVVAKKELEISEPADLEGLTVALSVPSSTTKPVVNYLFRELGVNVNCEMEATHDALVADLMKGSVDIAVLPEPKVSSVLLQSDAYEVAFPVGSYFTAISDTKLPMGCIVSKAEFIENNKELIELFLSDCKASVSFIGDPANMENAAQLVVNAGILPKTAVAKSALQNLYGAIAFERGAEMKNDLSAFYDILLDSMPAAIGNALPKEDFYYENQEN